MPRSTQRERAVRKAAFNRARRAYVRSLAALGLTPTDVVQDAHAWATGGWTTPAIAGGWGGTGVSDPNNPGGWGTGPGWGPAPSHAWVRGVGGATRLGVGMPRPETLPRCSQVNARVPDCPEARNDYPGTRFFSQRPLMSNPKSIDLEKGERYINLNWPPVYLSIDASFQFKKSGEVAVDDEESDEMPALIPDFIGYHGCSCGCHRIRDPVVKSKL
ncbi:hypothetical protein B0H13DRAFT_2385051 [Mycena leptocephala]|nr:hypothetical protein B0H13DRAFT_2385051 [Mycena leptocephala]